MENALAELIKISNIVGRDSSLVQGGGGNTSVKTPDGKFMYIKASGTALRDMNRRQGWRKLKLEAVLSILEDKKLRTLDVAGRETKIVRLLKRSCSDNITTAARPSVESVLHAMLGRCVIHLHPTAVEAYVCAKNGRPMLEKLFKDRKTPPLWIPYADPGYMLARKIAKLAGDYKKLYGTTPPIMFLEKHGLFVTADDTSGVLRLVRSVITLCDSKLKMRKIARIKPAKQDEINRAKLAIREAFFEVTGSHVPVKHFIDDDIRWFLARKDAKKLLSLPALTPDELVYAHGPAMWLDPSDIKAVKNKLNSLVSRKKMLPTGFLIRGLGLFVVGNEKAISTAKEVISSLILVRGFAAGFGGVNPMNKRQREFISQWESESFRKKLVSGLKNTG